MAFQTIAFLDRYGIDYRTSGKNCARGHVVVKCPWCGEDDPSEHLGIQIDGPFAYGCWRNEKHRGRNPVRLVQGLLKCSWAEAKSIAHRFGARNEPTTDDLEEAIGKLKGSRETPKMFHVEHTWNSFRSIASDIGNEPYKAYLVKRGIDKPDQFAEQYDLRFALSGKWSKRILIPVYDQNGKLVLAWTGRAIGQNAQIRYLSTREDDKAFRVNTLMYVPPGGYNPADTLVVTEGPFDALKLDWYGSELGVRATCIFSLSMMEQQVAHLMKLAQRFNRTVLCLDRGEYFKAIRLADRIPLRTLKVYDLQEAKDIGEMDMDEIRRLAEKMKGNCHG